MIVIAVCKAMKAVAKAWFRSSDVARELIQKKNQCCGFYELAEDIRCTHLYHEACGERIIDAQMSSLKFVSALVMITTVVDVFHLVIAIFLARIYEKRELQAKLERQQRQKITKTSQLRP